MKPSVSVVIPVYNSRPSLPELYDRLITVLEGLQRPFEIIMVDDYSQDGSIEVMNELHAQDARLGTIQLARNHGQHLATLCGMKYCRGELIVTIDDDLQNPPEAIPALLALIETGYEVVFAIPERKKQAFYRNLGSKLIQSSLTVLFSKPREIDSSSYRVLKRELAEKMLQSNPKYIYFAALIFENTSNAANLTVKHEKRKYGSSNYTLSRAFRLAMNLFLAYAFAAGQNAAPPDFEIAAITIEEGDLR